MSCGDDTSLVVAPSHDVGLGICDLCSYALRHVWKRELGEIIGAKTPRLVSNYVLVPRLPEGRSVLDIAAYKFLTVQHDDRYVLPSFEFSSGWQVAQRLESQYGVAAWESTLREIYLGYSATGEMANVLLAWAWGQRPEGLRPEGKAHTWTTFAELLAKPTPEAGFYLGVKAAFEALLWQREKVAGAEPDDIEPVSLFLSEPAVLCLSDHESPKMIELYRSILTPEEAEVVRVVQGDRRDRERLASEKPISSQDDSFAPASDDVGESDEGEDEALDDKVSKRNPASVPPGYARAPR